MQCSQKKMETIINSLIYGGILPYLILLKSNIVTSASSTFVMAAMDPVLFFWCYKLHNKLLKRGERGSSKTVSTTGNFNVTDVAPDLTEEQLEFYRQWTGSLDREFILKQWRVVKAKFHTYCCIQSMSYLNPRSSQLQLFRTIIEKSKELGGTIKIADVGCCFGQDVRNLIMSGISASSIYAIDLHDGYWKAGIELFKDEQLTTSNSNDCCVSKSRLDGVNKCFFDMSLPIGDIAAIESIYSDSSNSFDFVLMVAVLHTMSKDQQVQSLKRVHHLLKKSSGIVTGNCAGSKQCGPWLLTPDGSNSRFLNSVQSLEETLRLTGFENIKVEERAHRGWAGDTSSSRPKVPMDDNRERVFIEFSATAA